MYALLTAVFASASAITQKKILFKRHAMEFCTVLAIVILLFSLPLFWTIDYATLDLAPLLILYLASFIGTIAVLLITKAIRHMELSACIPLLSLSPLFTATVAFILLGEALTYLQVLGIIFLMFGSYFLTLKPHHSLWEPFIIIKKSKYIHYVFGGLFLFAFTSTTDRYILTTFNITPVAFVAFLNLFIAINFCILQAEYYKLSDIKGSLKHMGYWIILAALFSIGGRLAQMTAVSLAPVGLVVAVKRLSTLFTTVIGGEIYHEHNVLRRSLACIIMVAGAALMVI